MYTYTLTKMYINSKYQCKYKCIDMYTSNTLCAKDTVGQTPEKRHLGHDYSGALECMVYNQTVYRTVEYKRMHYYTYVTHRLWNGWLV